MSQNLARRARRAAQLLLVNGIAAQYWMPKRPREALMRLAGYHIGRSVVFASSLFRCDELNIGDNCFINHGCVFGQGDITLGDDVFIGPKVALLPDGHEIGPSEHRAGASTQEPIVVGRGSWIGAGAIVLGGVEIASGCVIAAGAVVTKSTEPDGLYAGMPARRIRDL